MVGVDRVLVGALLVCDIRRVARGRGGRGITKKEPDSCGWNPALWGGYGMAISAFLCSYVSNVRQFLR